MAFNIKPQYLTEACNVCRPSDYATCYHTEIPHNLDVKALLRQNPPSFSCNPNLFYYFVSLIYRGNAGNEKIEKNYFFTRLNATYLKHQSVDYTQYFNYLEEQKVIVVDMHFISSALSRGYSFTPEYFTHSKSITIHDRRLVSKLSNPIKKDGEKVSKVSTEPIPYLDKWFTPSLQIDLSAVKEYLRYLYEEDLKDTPRFKDFRAYRRKTKISLADFTKLVAINKYNARLRPAIEIHNSIQRTSIDWTVGRMHTPITNIKSELRQYISYNGETLVSLDLVNSQPFLSGALLKNEILTSLGLLETISNYNPNYKLGEARSITLTEMITSANNKSDVVKYLEWVESGQFYERFGEQLALAQRITEYNEGELRRYAKKSTFSAFFGRNSHIAFNRAYKLFADTFPTVAKIFRHIKYGDGYHNTLACTLQRVESELFLHDICGSIATKYPDAPIYTIHDSVVTTEAYKDRAKAEIIGIIHEKLGVLPTIKEEYWKPPVLVIEP